MEREQRSERSFDDKKTEFFSGIALSVLSALRLHKLPGHLWDRKDGKRDWGNVTEHCLVEVARVRELASKLRLSDDVGRSLNLAAALHDYNKRTEMLAIKAANKRGEPVEDVLDHVDEEKDRGMREAGFKDNVIELADIPGGESKKLFQMTEILEKESLSDHDIAFLVMHYVDGYTRNAQWTEPASVGDRGEVVNEVDRRMQKNLDNANYRKLNEESVAAFEGHKVLGGRGGIENDALICHMIEKKLAELILSRSGEEINPLDLPHSIDLEIKKKIEEVTL